MDNANPHIPGILRSNTLINNAGSINAASTNRIWEMNFPIIL